MKMFFRDYLLMLRALRKADRARCETGGIVWGTKAAEEYKTPLVPISEDSHEYREELALERRAQFKLVVGGKE